MFDLIRKPSTALGLSTFEEMDRLFDNLWRSTNLPSLPTSLTAMDIVQTDQGMEMRLDAAGFKPEDIQLNLRDNLLEVSGVRSEKTEQGDKKENYLVRESAASFARRIVLPEGADADNIKAELDNGILKISVPVNRPEAKRIQISSAKSDTNKKLTTKAEK